MFKRYLTLIIIFSFLSIMFSQKQESIVDKKEVARAYFESGLYKDAIKIYTDILDIQKNILGPHHLELIETLFELSDLYLNINDIESSEECLQNALQIQYNIFLKKQTDYIETYEKIKNLYIAINDTMKVTDIDSLLSILYKMNVDTLLVPEKKMEYPDLLYFYPITLDSTNLVSMYSNNDKALDLISNADAFLKTNLYSEAIASYDAALKLNANILNVEYLLNINFGDSLVINELYDILNEINSFDSTITKTNLLLGILDIQTSKNFSYIKNHLSQYINDYPEDYIGPLLLGLAYYKEADFFNALSYLFHAEMMQNDNIKTKLFLGMSLFNMGEYLDAIYKFEEVINLNEQNYDAKYYTGLAYSLLNNYSNAVQFLTQALLLDSSSDEIYYNLGLAYKELGKKRQSLEAFKQAIKLNRANGNAHFELGKIYEIILEIDLAIEHYNIATKYIVHDNLHFHYGTILYKNQLYKEAMAPLRKYIINNPHDTDVLTLLGDIFISEKRFPEAIDTYLRLLDDFPNHEDYYYLIAESYSELGNYHSAKEYYLQVLTFNEEHPEVLLKIGNMSNKLYQFEESEFFLKEAILCGTTSKDLLFELGIAYGGQSKYLQAMQVFQEARSYSLDDPILHYQLAVVYQALNLYELSITEYNKYLVYNPDDQIINYMIGESYFGLKKYNQAIASFKKVLDKYGYAEVKSLYQTGMCHVELGEYNNAAKYLKLVLKTNPDHSLSRYNLVDIYLSLNKAKEAKKECDILFMLDRDLYHSSNYCINY